MRADLFVILLLACLVAGVPTLRAAETPPPPAATTGLCGNSAYYGKIRALWAELKPVYQKWISGSDKTPYNLCNILGETNNLLRYSAYCKDTYILDQFVDLYLGALDTMDATDDYVVFLLSRPLFTKITWTAPMAGAGSITRTEKVSGMAPGACLSRP